MIYLAKVKTNSEQEKINTGSTEKPWKDRYNN